MKIWLIEPANNDSNDRQTLNELLSPGAEACYDV